MSSTNHTTNYNLPQFVGSDKPAWLGDINPAMSAIDTALHANATTATQGVSDAATAQTAANTADTKATAAQTAAETAQTTANQAVSGVNTNAIAISGLQNKFILDNITSANISGSGSWGNNYTFTLAQNDDGSVFKFYGRWWIPNATSSTWSVTKVPVPGLTNSYGFATGLYLNTAPTQAYNVKPAGICFLGYGDKVAVNNMWDDSFAVGTDGQIYVFTSDVQTENLNSGWEWRMYYYPCLYFNSNFGDQPANPSA